MFAGIVEGTRDVVAIKKQADGLQLRIDLQDLAAGISVGDSIAINGVCLTATDIEKSVVNFHAMTETLRKTTCGTLRPGSKVNIERSMRLGDTIDGHFVQGHVFGVGKITKRIANSSEFKLWIEAGSFMKYIAPLGSIAVDGVSLTVAEIRDNQFAVALIPVTLELTNLGQLQEGDSVNLEPDMIARQIVHFLERRPENILRA